MDGFEEQIPWDENEVQIEDLGAPDKGIGVFLFSCGRKLHTVSVRFRLMLAVLIITACLLALLLLPGSMLLSPVAPAHPPSTPSPQYIQAPGCNYKLVTPTEITNWLRQVAPESPGVIVIYNCGSP
jgi:hypothetical protein